MSIGYWGLQYHLLEGNQMQSNLVSYPSKVVLYENISISIFSFQIEIGSIY